MSGFGLGIGLRNFRRRGSSGGGGGGTPNTITYDTTIGNGVDSSGNTSLPLRAGAKYIFLNSGAGGVTGSDTNTSTQAQNPATPLATLSKAVSYVTQGAGDQILIAEGSTYVAGLPSIIGKDGFSAQYPTCIRTYDPADPLNTAKYGKPTTRPQLNTGATATQVLGQGSSGGNSYLVFQGLEWAPGNVHDQVISLVTASGGLQFNYYLWENCIFAYTGVSYNGNFGTPVPPLAKKHIFRNCSLYGQWSNSSSVGNQGIYMSGVDGLTVEDCVMWNCGWKIGANRNDDPTLGGATQFCHPLYIQSTCINTVERRNAIIQGSADGGDLKGGGLQMFNLGLNNPIAMANSAGNNFDIDKPFGAYAETSYNAVIGSEEISTFAGSGTATDWGYGFVNTINGSRAHHNVLAHSSALAGMSINPASFAPLHNNATNAMAGQVYLSIENNVFYQWAASGNTISSTTIPANVHLTSVNNNIWDDPTSGTNTNNGSVTFPNAHTETTLLAALGYVSESAAVNDWIANPQNHGWRTGWSTVLTGYGVSLPTLGDLFTNMSLTIGVASSGMFLGTIDGTSLTATGLPSGVALDSDCRCWRYDGSGTAGSGTTAVTESDGVNSHTTNISWTVSARPVLSSLSVTPGSTTATISVSANVGSGTLYYIVTTSATAPDWQYVRIGLNEDFSLPAAHGSQVVSATGAQSISATGLAASTSYTAYVMQIDSGDNVSLVGSSAFVTSASGAATLTSPTGSATSSTTASLGVTTDTGSGTLYWVVSTSSTPPSVAQIQAGEDSSGSLGAAHGSQTVSATGAQSASVTGLTASTTYYAYFQQHTTADSSVVSSASFATASGSFTPASLSPNFWVEADASHSFTDLGTTAVTTDGQSVEQVNDKSGHALNLTQTVSTTVRPTWFSNSGHPYWHFTRSSVQSLATATGQTLVDGTGQGWLAVVVQFDSVTSSTNAVVAEGAASSNRLIHFANNTGGGVFAQSFNNSGTSSTLTGGTLVANTPYVVIVTITPTLLSAYIDNVAVGSGTALTGTRNTSTGQIALGTSPVNGAPITGRIYAVVQGSGTLSSTDRANLQTYLSALHQ